jgi:hypothetical protein
MKSGVRISLSIAALALASFLANDAQAKDKKNLPVTEDVTTTRQESPVAFMVPAEAKLVEPLDQKKAQVGQTLHATLSEKVQLKNGTELPKGTLLVGTVAANEQNPAGGSKIVLRFTAAQLKDGKIVPVKVTIVGVDAPGDEADPLMNAWSQKAGAIELRNVFAGVNFQSDTASNDSGSFVSSGKTQVKLLKGSEFSLAIGAQQDAQGGGSGGA